MTDLTAEEMIARILESLRRTGERFAPKKKKKKAPTKNEPRASSRRSTAKTRRAASSRGVRKKS